MRVGAVLVITAAIAACGKHRDGNGEPDAPTGDACVGDGCGVSACAAMGKPETTVTGTVYAPNGTMPLYGIHVYVPASDPGPFLDGAQCDRCTNELPGQPVVQTISDFGGRFVLAGIPSGDNVSVVITSGKWRKKVVLPHVEACTTRALTASETRLPRDRSEGDLPQIAITTGFADSLECLIRKLGVADTEITNDTGGGRVHLYAGNLGKDRFKDGFPGGSGQLFADAQTLWNDLEKMKAYDVIMFSCEGAPYARFKPQAAMDAVKAYADFGGRLFLSHWHNVWLAGADGTDDQHQVPVDWVNVAHWKDNKELAKDSTLLIDEFSNPKGPAFASWMESVGGSAMRDRIALQNQKDPDPDTGEILSTGRTTCASIDTDRAERWVYVPADQGGGPQNFQFTTPNDKPDDQRCGKVVFSDMHVSGIAGDGLYPDSCGTSTELTPQEKALAFMFFDIASCVGVLL